MDRVGREGDGAEDTGPAAEARPDEIVADSAGAVQIRPIAAEQSACLRMSPPLCGRP